MIRIQTTVPDKVRFFIKIDADWIHNYGNINLTPENVKESVNLIFLNYKTTKGQCQSLEKCGVLSYDVLL